MFLQLEKLEIPFTKSSLCFNLGVTNLRPCRNVLTETVRSELAFWLEVKLNLCGTLKYHQCFNLDACTF